MADLPLLVPAGKMTTLTSRHGKLTPKTVLQMLTKHLKFHPLHGPGYTRGKY